MTGHRGFTLVETLVVLVLLGITFAAAAASMTALQADDPGSVPARLAEARLAAARDGQPRTVPFDGTTVTVYADGSATPAIVTHGGATWQIDPWTAEAHRVRE